MRIKATLETKVAGHYLPAIINGDYTGLHLHEVNELDAWLANYPAPQFTITTADDDQPEFANCEVCDKLAEVYNLVIVEWFTNRELYLDYVNNFITAEAFAEHYEMSLDQAHKLINEERAKQ